MPLSSLVDKVLESKAKELLPKISEVVDKLRENKTRDSSAVPSKQTAEKSTLEVPSKPKSTDFGSFPLPIDIPGLTTSTGGTPSTKKEPSEGKAQLKATKPKANDVSVKENKTKGKAGQPKVTTSAKESVKREKEVVGEREKLTEEGGKEKDKHKSSTKLKKNKDDKGPGVNKEKSQDWKTEKQDDAKGANVRRDKSEKVVDIKDGGPREKSLDGKLRDTEKAQQESHPDSKDFSGNESKRVTGAQHTESEVQSDSKKVLPARRRSARIASLSEDNGKEEGESESQKARGRPCDEETMDHKGVSEEAKITSDIIKRKRKHKAVKSEGQKKRQRLLSSSTDEELGIQEPVSSEEESEDIGKYASKNKSKPSDIYTKRAKKRSLQQTAEDSPVSEAHKKARRLSKTFNDSPSTQEAADRPPLPEENIQKPHRRKSSQPQRLPVRSSKSPPVVVTRYNRQIKPNRRYLDTSGEPSEAGSEGEDETGDRRDTPQDSEAYTDIDSSGSEHG